MAEVPASEPGCIDLDHRFVTNVLPDPEEATEIAEQDQCDTFIAGERCYYRLSNPSAAPCRFQSAQVRALGNLMTEVTFKHIVEPLDSKDDTDTQH